MHAAPAALALAPPTFAASLATSTLALAFNAGTLVTAVTLATAASTTTAGSVLSAVGSTLSNVSSATIAASVLSAAPDPFCGPSTRWWRRAPPNIHLHHRPQGHHCQWCNHRGHVLRGG